MKKMAILLVWVLALAGCYINPNSKSSLSEADFMNDDLKVYGAYKTELVGPIEWEDNESVDALKDLVGYGMNINMSMYGGFEQVGVG